MKIAACQFAAGSDEARNLKHCLTACRQATDAGAALLVLPEAAAFLRGREEDAVSVQDDDGAFISALCRASAQYRLAIAAGCFAAAADGRAYNTIALLQHGALQLRYRKLHLYDALAVQESARIAPGETLPPIFSCAGVRIGIMTCYDLRFPETARSLAERGAEIIIVPAAWFAGAEKEQQWQILCAARAIENGVYLLGAGMSGAGRIGRSCWVDPNGIIRAQLGQEEGLLCGEFDRTLLERIRTNMPLLAQRRFAIHLQKDSRAQP